MERSVEIFQTPYLLAERFAEDLAGWINSTAKREMPFSVALSGGSTPELLFSLLGDRYEKSIPWNHIQMFWGDERCVPPENSESNYGMTKARLIDKIEMKASNVHRIRGEEEPGKEAERYSAELLGCLPVRNGLPFFDLILLGMGEDGHTASIFPGNTDLFTSDKICVAVSHPESGQKRITLTGRIINNASAVVFLVTGKKKAEVVADIINKKQSSLNYPAANIVPLAGSITWFLDKEAGSLL